MKRHCIVLIAYSLLCCSKNEKTKITDDAVTQEAPKNSASFFWAPKSLTKLDSLKRSLAALHKKGCYTFKDPHWEHLRNLMPINNDKTSKNHHLKLAENLNISVDMLNKHRALAPTPPEVAKASQELSEATAATKDLSAGIHRVMDQSKEKKTVLQLDNALDNINHAYKQLEILCLQQN